MRELTPKYRFELLVPLFHNDGSPVEPERIQRVTEALRERFGAYRFQPTAPHTGMWTDVRPDQEPVEYRDDLIMLTSTQTAMKARSAGSPI